MKKTPFIATFLLGAVALGLTAAPKDAILMHVDGKAVPVSEFQYLRNKNNSQQQQAQSLDEYLQMFIDYKLKVAAAEAAGIDTTAKFCSEYEQFRTDLARPYLRDAAVEEALIQDAVDHRKEYLVVSHIMFDAAKPGATALADSLRDEIIKGNASYEDVARQYSVDRPSKARGGLMGAVVPGRYPWAFEKAAYDLKPGEISPVVNSGFGLHIIRLEKREPSQGEIEASHILCLTRGMSDEVKAAQKAKIDSIYNLAVAPGADFAALAREFSEDPGSAARGGSLGFFGQGLMVQPFDSIAFAMKDGEISKPFETDFGWHIIYRTGHRDIEVPESLRDNIKKAIEHDDRAALPEKAFLEKYIASKKGGIQIKNINKLASMVPAQGLDAKAEEAIMASKLPVYKLGKTIACVSDIIAPSQLSKGMSAEEVKKYLSSAAENSLDSRAKEMAEQDLEKDNPDYRNLLNEYRDGILLYEISNEHVWDRAAKDKEGLEAYFKANHDKYKWDAPKFKSIIIFAQNDSILDAARAYADSLDASQPTKFVDNMRAHFGRNIKVERVIAAKGENAITDYLAFGGEKPATDPKQRWQSYCAYKGRIIDAPEEAADVRGLAVTDYQTALEKEWLDELHKNHKVIVDQKVLESLR